MSHFLTILFFLFSFSQFSFGVQFFEREVSEGVSRSYSSSANIRNELSHHRRNINSLSAKVIAFQEKFHSLGQSKRSSSNAGRSSNVEFEKPLTVTESFEGEIDRAGSLGLQKNNPTVSMQSNVEDNKLFRPRKLGFYLLPFMALQSSGDFRSKIFQAEIEQDLGFSSGWRMGVESPHFFIEGEFAYSRNKLKGEVNIPLLPPSFNPINVDGESEGFGVLINAGGRFSLSDQMSVLIGAGFGAVNQEIGFEIASSLTEEEDTLFTYQLFSGVNYDFSDHFRLGFRYRWLRLGEMENYSERNLHLAELSMGYVF
jgi:opacity protein-like surface antigen